MLNETLAYLAQTLPGATAVFHRHGLSFCCGGQQTLLDAAIKKGLSAEAIAEELEQIADRQHSSTDWQQASDQQLIEHIIERYHKVHREQLGELSRLAKRVEKVHGDHPYCPKGLADFLDYLREDLEQHMQKEEQVLFPMLLRNQSQLAAMPISVMRHEHDLHQKQLDDLAAITQGFSLPNGACNTWRALYSGLSEFERDVRQHIALENTLLFERHTNHKEASACASSLAYEAL